MKKKEKKKIFELYSDNNKVINNLIEKMKSNSKAYSKLKTALELLGSFEGKVDVELYDVVKIKMKVVLDYGVQTI